MAPRRKSKKGYFIDKAIEHPGTFHNYCARKGFSKVNNACIQKGLHSRNALTRKRANLARNLARLRKRRRH